jgi:hypothetical protein
MAALRQMDSVLLTPRVFFCETYALHDARFT